MGAIPNQENSLTPAPEPVVRLPDDLPEVIRAVVTPLIEAIRASHEAMRASHAQQSQATDAVLRVISAVRVEPATVAVPVPVLAAAGQAVSADTAEPVPAAVGEPVAVAVEPAAVAGESVAAAATQAAGVAAEPGVEPASGEEP
ncbi:MAG TPA: hypothetical protein VEQ60_21075, partial [Longimicrobium sp.]|nr:hypothetical protein [Longimicrobium sp.]